MEEEIELQNKYVDLMSSTEQVAIQSPHRLAKQGRSDEEKIIPLQYGPIMDTYDLNYEEIQKNIIQAQNKKNSG